MRGPALERLGCAFAKTNPCGASPASACTAAADESASTQAAARAAVLFVIAIVERFIEARTLARGRERRDIATPPDCHANATCGACAETVSIGSRVRSFTINIRRS